MILMDSVYFTKKDTMNAQERHMWAGAFSRAFGFVQKRFYSQPNYIHERPTSKVNYQSPRNVKSHRTSLADARRGGNAAALAGIGALVGGVFFYTMWKVSQDDFSDVDSKGNVQEKVRE
jgi:hypothetical protein